MHITPFYKPGTNLLLSPRQTRRLVILLFIIASITTGESFASPATKSREADDSSYKKPSIIIYSDPVVTSDSVNCVIPFTKAGNLILLKGKADSTEGNFILDTGAPNLVLNITYFRNYATTNAQDKGGITGDVATASQTNIASFSFGPIKYYRLEADLINLGHIENSKGVKILGLLGMQLFTKFEMIIDYEKSLLYLHLINRKEAATYKSDMLKDPSTYSTIPIDVFENKIIAYSEIAGKKLKFVVDSGAESNVLDSRLPNKIFENVAITGRVILNGSSNKKVEALHGDLKNLKIGDLKVSSLPVLITNLEKMCYSYNDCIDGMLGFDFLSLHKIGFNFVTHKMYIWK